MDVFRIAVIIVFIAAAIVMGTFLAIMLVKHIRNFRSPQRTIQATIFSKREEITKTHMGNAGDPTGAHGFHTISYANYYIIFRTVNGERLELEVGNSEYTSLNEGYTGILTYQGSKYLGFTYTR